MNPLLVIGSLQGALLLGELNDRAATYSAARAVADRLGKPLLNVGCPAMWPAAYPCGDVCLDISRERLAACRSPRPTYGDVRAIPFPDKSFGAVTCFHVLEHLPNEAAAHQAVREVHRVADHVYILSPSRLFAYAWIHHEHQLWVDQEPDDSLRFEQRDGSA